MIENYEWIRRCINSCMNEWQLKTAFKMVELFHEGFGKHSARNEYEDLLQILVNKQATLAI